MKSGYYLQPGNPFPRAIKEGSEGVFLNIIYLF